MSPLTKIKNLSQCAVFMDFDNTVSTFDVLDDLIKRFSIDKNWLIYEKLWKEGTIGSRECLIGQLKSVRISRKDLMTYLKTIKIDLGFRKLLTLLKKYRLRPVILSDSFSYLIKKILNNSGIKGLKIYANEIKIEGDRLIPSFPYSDKSCLRCAHCKKRHLLKKALQNKTIIYVGDGLSDVCPSRVAHVVFAKGGLINHLGKEKISCIPFKQLEDVYSYLKRSVYGSQKREIVES